MLGKKDFLHVVHKKETPSRKCAVTKLCFNKNTEDTFLPIYSYYTYINRHKNPNGDTIGAILNTNTPIVIVEKLIKQAQVDFRT